MLLVIVVLITVVAFVLVISSTLRVPGGVNPANLGWMSEQWLAEYRASHAS
jgi:hypothetical protein